MAGTVAETVFRACGLAHTPYISVLFGRMSTLGAVNAAVKFPRSCVLGRHTPRPGPSVTVSPMTCPGTIYNDNEVASTFTVQSTVHRVHEKEQGSVHNQPIAEQFIGKNT